MEAILNPVFANVLEKKVEEIKETESLLTELNIALVSEFVKTQKALMLSPDEDILFWLNQILDISEYQSQINSNI